MVLASRGSMEVAGAEQSKAASPPTSQHNTTIVMVACSPVNTLCPDRYASRHPKVA